MITYLTEEGETIYLNILNPDQSQYALVKITEENIIRLLVEGSKILSRRSQKRRQSVENHEPNTDTGDA